MKFVSIYVYNKHGGYMYDFIEGKVEYIYSGSISINASGVGYLINTPSPYSFKEGENARVYVYEVVREDELSLYGFKSQEERSLFLKLISVKGLGPKMALPMLATGSVNGIVDAIQRENYLYLKKFPKIGDKVAKQIVLDLKGKVSQVNMAEEDEDDSENDLYDALISLGYKDKEIKGVIGKVDKTLSIGDQIKDALKMLLK